MATIERYASRPDHLSGTAESAAAAPASRADALPSGQPAANLTAIENNNLEETFP